MQRQKPIAALIETYRSTAVAWDRAQNNAKEANPLFVHLHEIYKELRTEQAGRDGIAALMDDENSGVRLNAASHSLAWSREKAEKVLEEMQAQPGLYAVDAKYTLREFRAGRLNLDW